MSALELERLTAMEGARYVGFERWELPARPDDWDPAMGVLDRMIGFHGVLAVPAVGAVWDGIDATLESAHRNAGRMSFQYTIDRDWEAAEAIFVELVADLDAMVHGWAYRCR